MKKTLSTHEKEIENDFFPEFFCAPKLSLIGPREENGIFFIDDADLDYDLRSIITLKDPLSS